MDVDDLSSTWEKLEEINEDSQYNLLRISPNCLASLYLGVSPSGNHCLVLNLSKNYPLKARGFEKENIRLEYQKSKGYLILELLNDDYLEVFNDLILSIYHKIKNVTKDSKSSSVFLELLYSWGEFFLRLDNKRLSEEEIRGLWGELFILRDILNSERDGSVNEVISSWKGPYKQTHDFELGGKSLEVKTKYTSRKVVSISSAKQLEEIGGKDLHLVIVSLRKSEEGLSLEDLAFDIKKNINLSSSDLSIFLKALSTLNLDLKKLKQFDAYRFVEEGVNFYDCLVDGFPRLTLNSNLPPAVSSVKYDLETEKLSNYLLDKDVYEY